MAYHLNNGILEVEFAAPGEGYTGTRFDWNGFILQVKLLKEGHTFCVPESRIPGQGTGGCGLCNEFGIEQTPGYDAAAPGENFAKLGVGLLMKENTKPYLFFENFKFTPVEREIRQGSETAITFTSLPQEVHGFAAAIEKTYTIIGNRLHIHYRLSNTGTRQLQTDEYVHNFLGINGSLIGPDYQLEFPYAIKPLQPDPNTMDEFTITGNTVSWPGTPTKDFYFKLDVPKEAVLPFLWDVRHLPSGAGVRELSTYDIAKAAVWGQGHVVSPEMFVNINVKPGEVQVWERVYEFYS